MTDDNGGLRWGVVGTGGIAHSFLEGLRAVPSATVTAVGSRTRDRADEFADAWGVPERHGSYEELAQSPNVDAVYVATPHPWHHPNTLTCLNAGKHVLVEKPMAMNALQVSEMVAAARANDRFLMEAMWTRYLPVSRLVRELVDDGAIGEVCWLSAEFGANVPYDPDHRIFNADLGGGALLDLGIYPLAFASRHLGELTVVGATRQLSPDRMVDTHTTVLVRGENGATGTLSCSSRTTLPNRAVVAGSKGWLEIPNFFAATTAVLHRDGREREEFHRPFRANGYEYEAEEVARCVAAGERESPDMPWSESLHLARISDQIRDVGGLVYSPANVKAVPLG
ncbi:MULTISPECIES: Gfo/Idh/MocA family protein [Nocardiopsidaceae]|jgi:predicted dehydrogenase|uniref:Gfo/Idh/MocA family oxidoreductase n=2 Tax=Nocardiopsidaceae TaxID=83676 RepID=A0ABY6YVM6_9ACTN|nr:MULTISPECIES: Gfo/Idh/MocA family oxidoreductase [Nocardiopsaceae]MEE2051976.1 Gfo/Idh/MocA family oxidoreductase [Nocardiopsis umidischolae]WAE76312.1 Gfo/Idh/MocA family oxidoreductase [Streptomonospora nanhaiensis]